jgi:NADH dehydrogenase
MLALLDGETPTPFSYAQLGMLVSLGRFRGVGEIFGIKISGLLAWIAWRGYYLLRLPTWDRKIRVAVDWTLDWFLRRDIVEINVRRTQTIPRESGEFMSGQSRTTGSPEAEDDLTLG